MSKPADLPGRTVIYSRDIQVLMGKSESAARQYLWRLRRKLGKNPWQVITMQELHLITDIELEVIKDCMKL